MSPHAWIVSQYSKFQGMPTYSKLFQKTQAFPMEKKTGLFLRVGDTTLDFEGQCIYLAAMERVPNSHEVPMTNCHFFATYSFLQDHN